MARHLVSVFIALFFFLRCSIAIVSWRIYVWQQHLISPMGALFGKIAIRHERKQKRMLLGRRARWSSVLWKYIHSRGIFNTGMKRDVFWLKSDEMKMEPSDWISFLSETRSKDTPTTTRRAAIANVPVSVAQHKSNREKDLIFVWKIDALLTRIGPHRFAYYTVRVSINTYTFARHHKTQQGGHGS